MSLKFPKIRFFPLGASLACALSSSFPGVGNGQDAVPAPPVISATPVTTEAEPPSERSLVPIPGFLKKDEAAEAPLLQQPSSQAVVKPDLAKMDVNGINLPELQRIPETELPAILQSEDARKKAETTEKSSGPFGLFGKDEPVATAAPVQGIPARPIATPVAAPPSQSVETLRAAETQADSFTAALAVASDGSPIVATPAPMPAEAEDEGFLKSMGGILKRDEAAAESVATEEKSGMFSSIGGVFKKDDQPEPAAETFPEPVASEKRGLLPRGLFGGKKDKEPEALQTPVPGLSDIGEPMAEEEKKAFRLPKLFGGGEE